MNSLLVKATAVAGVVAVLAATAAAAGSYIPTPPVITADFLLSPGFILWVTANAIVIWLRLSSSSRRGNKADGGGTASSSSSDLHDAMDSLYTSSSEYEAFSDAGGRAARRADATVPDKRLAREARAAARRADRPRVRKKPAGQDAPSPRAVAAAAAAREPDYGTRGRGAETHVAATAVATESTGARDGAAADDEDVSMDSLWQSIVQRRAARPVVVQKSESWGNDELPRLQRVAETAAATRREMRKSVSAVNKAAAPHPHPKPPQPSVPSAVRQLGWRTRDVLVTFTPDELLRRAESFIRRQHEHLRLQRQESEQRQLRRGLHAPTLIRDGV